MTALVFGARTDLAPKRNVAPDAYVACANLLLDMSYLGDELGYEEKRSETIIARIERHNDEYPFGTPERNEAEVLVLNLRASAKRKRKKIGTLAERFVELWPKMDDDHRELFLSSINGCDYATNPMWAVVQGHAVGRNPIWETVAQARAANPEEVPF